MKQEPEQAPCWLSDVECFSIALATVLIKMFTGNTNRGIWIWKNQNGRNFHDYQQLRMLCYVS